MMKTIVLFILVFLSLSYGSVAQMDTNRVEASLKNRRAKAIYVEVFGSSGFSGSLNYDMRFKPGRKGWGFRVGMTPPLREGQAVTYGFPLLINKLSSNRSAAFEAGAGILVTYRRLKYEDTNFIIQKKQGFDYPAVANIGVRFQPLRTGIVWRLYWAPSWRFGSYQQFMPYWFGTSLGIGFH